MVGSPFVPAIPLVIPSQPSLRLPKNRLVSQIAHPSQHNLKTRFPDSHTNTEIEAFLSVRCVPFSNLLAKVISVARIVVIMTLTSIIQL